ncbi:MAG: ribbon-helix-helix protein, CopG family [Spirochaetaceae bacterium]|nr:MAG: ribbon-helix-helix protein, CopG family [Spirochaetaceae bacterium]
MKRTQVQVPDPLYEQARKVAELRDWSVSEVFRRALEQYVAEARLHEHDQNWALPEPRAMGAEMLSHEQWRDLSAADEERLYGTRD